MSTYRFTGVQKLLQDQKNSKLPKFIFSALRNGTLEVRGPETDKKLYKTYLRQLPGFTKKTRILKEINHGTLFLENKKGEPVISDVGYNNYRRPSQRTIRRKNKYNARNRANTKRVVDSRYLREQNRESTIKFKPSNI